MPNQAPIENCQGEVFPLKILFTWGVNVEAFGLVQNAFDF